MRFVPDRHTLLTGDVRALTLRLCAPSFFAMLATGGCTLLDALYVSRADASVSAAVSIGFPLLTLIQTVGFTLGMGAGSHVSRSLGQNEQESAQQVAVTALLFAVVLGFALLAPGLFLAAPLARLLGAQETATSAVYVRYVLLSAPLQCAGLTLSSLLRGQGKTPSNLLAYGLSSALGAVLGYVLIIRQGLGIHGAGISLLAREALATGVLAICAVRDRKTLSLSPRSITLRPWVLAAIMRSGLPTLLRQGTMSLSGILLSHVSRSFGVLPGMGIAVRASALISSAVIGFGQGFQPVCGFNTGAGRMDRVLSAYRFCLRITVLALLAAGAAVFFAAEPLLGAFGARPEVAAFAVRALRAQSVVFFAQGSVIMMNTLTQSIGLTIRATLVAVSRQGLFLVPMLLLLPRLWGEWGLILSQTAADLLALGFSWLLTRPVTRIAR